MSGRNINVADIIDQNPVSRFQVRVFVLCGLVVLLDGFDAQAIAFVAAPIARDLAIPISAFGVIFAAGTIGLSLGAFVLPPFADRYGRRYQIIIAVAIFGIFSLATARANSFAVLAALRFLTGIGVGAAVPNVVPLVSEFAPRRIRAVLITAVTVSWPLGAVLGGLISAKLIPAFGWPSVFYVGGAAPILLALGLLPTLPESVRFMATKDNQTKNIAKILTRIAPDPKTLEDARFVLSEEKLHGFSVRHLFSGKRAAATLLLWVAFFMNFGVLFFIFNWLPPLMQQAGFSVERAIIATVVFNFGGIVGGIALGRLMDKFGNYFVVGLAYAFGAIFVGAIGFFDFSIPLLMISILLAGFCSVGTQVCGNALAAGLYPTGIRSTGVGWAYGVGRIGSIFGPLLGGLLLALHWDTRSLFLISAAPLVCATIAIVLLSQACRGIDKIN
jgi:AAHS family 4-hydroxybenzoate transporter-like MFS transporter